MAQTSYNEWTYFHRKLSSMEGQVRAYGDRERIRSKKCSFEYAFGNKTRTRLSREQRKLIPIAIIDAKPKCKKEMSDKLKMIIDASEQENISCDKLEKIPVTIVGMRQSINGEKERKHSLARKQTNFIIRRCLNLPLFIYCSHYEMSKERSVTNFTVLFTSFSNKIQQRSIKEMYNFCYYSSCDSKSQLHSVCFQCKFVLSLNRHQHDQEQYLPEREHFLAIDLKCGQIYCMACNNLIWDEDVLLIAENLAEAIVLKNDSKTILNQKSINDFNENNKKKLVLYSYDLEKLNYDTEGLLGLVNLGSTCFFNCVIQALLHTPIVRDYFLGQNHVCKFKNGSMCLLCELNRIQNAFYDEKNKTPYTPSTLLHLVWTQAKHLAGYEQQDAHEFFISILDIMHRHAAESDKTATNQKCHCLVDKIFSGCLQSDVKCQVCGGVSSVDDPIWDFSLDLVNNHPENGQTYQQPASLHDCLSLYTRTEHLGSSAKIRCSKCGINQESTKRLSFKKLPIVASFHLKRFEQTTRYKRKITNYISFPLTLNLFQYTSSQIGANGSSIKYDLEMEEDYSNYFLYAVINHTGTLETGHYTAYIRQTEDEWYQCDDHFILRATTEQVLQSEAYLLFYHNNYYNDITPTTVLLLKS
ncbi:hypothetical protein RDWZM_005586 [Blomia tropicalis]|uniref:Ubiquitin carboxyl-terminal hydrolase n=1 Tax=Blomia tropicalis TaxID=40697 RepID=A0A9Q0RMH0_BLOTA|nr:hypothetical protein RDWZM_005586 [Blomia tropicalis]